MDANGDLNVLVLAAVALADHGGQPQPIPQHNSMLTGALYYEEIMATVDENRFLHVARMDKATFILLKDLLMGIRGLLDSLHICARILLYVMRGHTNRERGAAVSGIIGI
jgi:hypothetical protein